MFKTADYVRDTRSFLLFVVFGIILGASTLAGLVFDSISKSPRSIYEYHFKATDYLALVNLEKDFCSACENFKGNLSLTPGPLDVIIRERDEILSKYDLIGRRAPFIPKSFIKWECVYKGYKLESKVCKTK